MAALATTSTSSASLRAVEVARPIEELETSDAFDRAPPEVSMVARTAAARARAPQPGGGSLVGRLVLPTLGAGLVLGAALALGSHPPGAAPVELAAAPPPPVEPAAVAAVAATAETSPAPAAESEPVPAASAEPAPPALLEPAPSSLPAHDQEALEGVLHWGFSRAQACHREGRPSGTVRAIVTFGPEGKVRLAKLEGEPIASAAVGKCMLSLLRSMMIPAFSGPEFSITREITLR